MEDQGDPSPINLSCSSSADTAPPPTDPVPQPSATRHREERSEIKDLKRVAAGLASEQRQKLGGGLALQSQMYPVIGSEEEWKEGSGRASSSQAQSPSRGDTVSGEGGRLEELLNPEVARGNEVEYPGARRR